MIKDIFESEVFKVVLLALLVLLALYGIFGLSHKVDDIKRLAPADMARRGWEIVRYEGFQHGRFGMHGGSCWYHVRNIDDHKIQYRVQVSIWGDELQYHYNGPEKLVRIEGEI